MKLNWHKKDLLWIILGLFIVLLSIFPYWIFGRHSAIGWYDELDYYVPLYFSRYVLGYFEPFAHNYAGGYAPGQSLMGNELFSLYGFLLKNFDLWLANFLLRLLGLFFSFASTYLTLRHLFGRSGFLTFAITSFCLFSTIIPFGWSLDGMGFDFGVFSLLILACFANFQSIWINFFIAVFASLISSVASSPTFALFQFLFAFVFITMFCQTQKSQFNQVLRNFGVASFTFGFAHLINWIYAIKLAVLDASEYSSRILGTLSSSPVETASYWNFIVKFKYFFVEFLSTLQRQPNIKLLFLYVAIVILYILRNEVRKIPMFFAFILSPVFLNIFLFKSSFPVVSAFRFSTLWLITPLLLSYLFIYLWDSQIFLKILDKKHRIMEPIVSILLVILTFLSISDLTSKTILELKQGSNSTSLLTEESGFLKISKTSEKFRSISAGYSGVIPIFHKVATYDGIVHSSPYRRNIFSAYAISYPPKNTFHVHRLFFYTFPNNFNAKALKIANVKHIVSDHALEGPEYKLLHQKPAVYSDQIKNWSSSLFHFFSNKILLHAPLFIYSFADSETWDRVFSPKNLIISEFSYTEKEFYKELISLEKNSLLVSSIDRSENLKLHSSNLIQIEEYTLTNSGVEIETNGQPGVLVYNQVYLPKWKAYCDTNKEKLEIIPVNGIMMTVEILSENCKKVIFEYSP